MGKPKLLILLIFAAFLSFNGAGYHQCYDTIVSHDTHYHGGDGGGPTYQDWHASFSSYRAHRGRSSTCGGVAPDTIYISDDDGNSASVSNPGDNYRLWSDDYSWLEYGDQVTVYFEAGGATSSQVTRKMPYPNNPPNTPDIPYPIDNGHRQGSPVTISARYTDPEDDPGQLHFYDSGGYVDSCSVSGSGDRCSVNMPVSHGNNDWYAVAEDNEGSKSGNSPWWTVLRNTEPNQLSSPLTPSDNGFAYNQSVTLRVEAKDSNSDSVDVSFYNGMNYTLGKVDVAQWYHDENVGAGSKSELDQRMDDGSKAQYKLGETTVSKIDCTKYGCNFFGTSDTYGTCMVGYLYAPESGTYTFATDSADASDFYINTPSTEFERCNNPSTSNRVVSWYGKHADSGGWGHTGTVSLSKGYHSFMYRQSSSGGDEAFRLGWQKPSDSSVSLVPESSYFGESDFLVKQGSNTWKVEPNVDDSSSGSWYQGSTQGTNDFIVTLYRNSKTGDTSLVFGSSSSSNRNAQLDLRKIPASSSQVTISDDTGGNYRHNSDELSLGREPEGDWSWGSSNHDGGAIQLGDNWKSITLDPGGGLGIGPDLVFQRHDGSTINLNDGQELTIKNPLYSRALIGRDTNVPAGGTAAVEWSNLEFGENYTWFAELCDSHGECAVSDKWNFTLRRGNNEPTDPVPADGGLAPGKTGQVGLNARYVHDGGFPGNLSFYNADTDNLLGTCTNVPSGERCRNPVMWDVNRGQTYSWYAVSEYQGSTIQGPTWTFKVNHPPAKITSPDSPADGGVVYGDADLKVTPTDPNGHTMDVEYFTNVTGSEGVDTDVDSGTQSEKSVSGLDSGTYYEWWVTVSDPADTVESKHWTFKTNTAPYIQSKNPGDGDTVTSEPVKLEVVSTDDESDAVDVYFFKGDGSLMAKVRAPSGGEAEYTWNGLENGRTYDWYVKISDGFKNYTSSTFTFAKTSSTSYKVNQKIDHRYSSIISDVSSTKTVFLVVENEVPASKTLTTTLSGVNANFFNGGSSKTYSIAGNSQKRFQIQIDPQSVGDKTLVITTENTDLGVGSSISIPVTIRKYTVVAEPKGVPGLTSVYMVMLLLSASVIYYSRI